MYKVLGVVIAVAGIATVLAVNHGSGGVATSIGKTVTEPASTPSVGVEPIQDIVDQDTNATNRGPACGPPGFHCPEWYTCAGGSCYPI